MDLVIIAMILVAAFAGGIISLVHRGRARMWGLLAVLLSFGTGVFLYNYISLLRNWKHALLITSVCIVLLVVIYLLLVIKSLHRIRQKKNKPAQDANREVISTPPRAPVPISEWETSAQFNPALTMIQIKAISRKIPDRSAADDTQVAALDMEIPDVPLSEVTFTEPAIDSLPIENTCSQADEAPELLAGELAVSEPALPAKTDYSEAGEAPEQPAVELALSEPVLSAKTDCSETGEAPEQPAVELALSEPVLSAKIDCSEACEAPEQSAGELAVSEPVLSAKTDCSETGEALEPVGEIAVSELIPSIIIDCPEVGDTPAKPELVFMPAEVADTKTEEINEQPEERTGSGLLCMTFEEYMKEITELAAAKRYVDAQASIFKMLNQGYDMTSDDKQRVLLIMKLLKEREKKADGATPTR